MINRQERAIMEKKKNNRLLITALALLAVVFVITAVISARSAYNKRIAEEKLTEVDFYSMQEFCGQNSTAVMDALASGNKAKLEKLMPGAEGIDDVMGFADWSKADLKNAVSMGAGSLSASPDKNGMMDISEKFIVQAGDDKYVLFIETITSRWGRKNEGVSSVGVTTYEHFSDLNYDWAGEPDDQSVLAGKLRWKK